MRCWIGLGAIFGLVVFAGAAQPDPGPLAKLQQFAPGAALFTSAEQAGLPTRVYGVPLSFGATPEHSAAVFLAEHAALFQVSEADLAPGNAAGEPASELMLDPETGGPKFTLFYFTQMRDGLPVFRSDLRLLVRNMPGNPVVLASSSLRPLGDFTVAGARAATELPERAAHAAAAAAVDGLANFSAPELVIWAGADDVLATPRVAFTFVADNGRPATADYHKWLFVADAETGALLYSESMICHLDVTGSVSGYATTGSGADVCFDEPLTPLPYARVNIGGTVSYADAQGNFVLPYSGSAPVTVSSQLSGQYFVVQNHGGPNTVLTATVNPPGPVSFIHNQANDAEFYRAEVNGYLQANVVRGFTLLYCPNYPTVSTQTFFPVNVNIDSSCNAYYDYSSINMFRAGGGGCTNTAYSAVIHHEYGHHLVATGGSLQGAYGEGMSDCIAMLIADDPIMAYGFYGDCEHGIRTAINDLDYPCSGEIHYCGQLLSGCVWDTRTALQQSNPATYLSIISELTVNSILVHGQSNAITPQITIDFLTLDDDDGDLSNGTPHWDEICTGFGNHNMGCPPLGALLFNYPAGRPVLLSPYGDTVMRVEVQARSKPPLPGTGVLTYSVAGGAFKSVPLQQVEPNVYDVTFPAMQCNKFFNYYITAQTTDGQTVFDPPNAPSQTYAAVTGEGLSVLYEDAFEVDSGWTAGDPNDTATAGIWSRNVPQATVAQPGDDHTPGAGTKCWVTDYRAGNNAADFDVDGGRTTVTSPTYNLSGYPAAVASYWRWYSNGAGENPHNDVFRVEISWDDGANWFPVESVGPSGPNAVGGWRQFEFAVHRYAILTSTMRFRFIAQDLTVPSLVEAALDDFQISVPVCTVFASGDLNCDGAINFGDINPFVLAISNPGAYATTYPYCDRLKGDINGDGFANFVDINRFVALLAGQ